MKRLSAALPAYVEPFPFLSMLNVPRYESTVEDPG